MKTEVNLTYTKSTKGTHVYGTQEDGAAVSSVYIKRDALPKDAPKVIKLTIEVEDE